MQLTGDQRAALVRREDGQRTLRQRNRDQVLLRSDGGSTGELGICVGTFANVCRRFNLSGLDAVFDGSSRPRAVPVLDGKAEAIVIATGCSPAPEGRATWTAQMQANRLVELQVVESVSKDTVLRVLKKVPSSRGRRRCSASPRGSMANSIQRIEDVLEL